MARTQTDRAVIDLVINGQQARTTLKEVSLAASRARADLLKMKEADNPELYKAKLAEMHKLIAAQRDMRSRIDDTTTAWGRFKKEMATVAVGVVGGNVMTFMLQQLVSFIPSAVDRTMKLRDSFADMEKATGLSSEGVKELNKELKQIDTRTANGELRQIAVAGGQLGVANDELKDFVQNADMAVVALGDEFSGGVEQVTKEIGGIGKLFDDTKNLKAGDQLNVIGSALNELGAAGSATSPVVADFTTRMGALGDLGPKLSETLGLGAALQELGLSAEIGASGLTGVLTAASTQSELFAQHLGMSKAELKGLIDSNPNAFLMQMAKSFQGVAPTDVMARLKGLKIESQEAAKVMMLLADQTGFVEQKQQLAAKAMSEGTSLASEFAKKNHQLARDLKDLNEWFNSLFTSDAIENFLVSAVHNAVEFTKALPKVVDWLKQNKEWFYIMAAASVAYYTATIKATYATIANTVAETYRKVAYELGFRAMVVMEAASKAYALVTTVLTGTISLQTAALTVARTAWASLTAIMAANPVGAIVVGFTALYVVLRKLHQSTSDAIHIERQYQIQKNLVKMQTDHHRVALEELNKKMGDYHNLSKEEQAQIKKTATLKLTEAAARLANANAKAREMRNEAGRKEVTDADMWEEYGFTMNIDKQKKRLELRQKRMREADGKAGEGTDVLKQQIEENKRLLEQIGRADAGVSPGSGSLRKLANPADKKRGAEKKTSEAEREQEEFDKLMGEARERASGAEASEYEKSSLAFAQKYARLYELAKGGEDQLNEIRRLSMLEWAGIEKKRGEAEAKAAGDQAKAVAENSKKLAEEAIRHGEINKETALFGIRKQEAEGTITPDQSKQQQLDTEYQYLMGELLMRQLFARDTTEVYRQMNDNIIAQAEARRDKEKSIKDAIKEQEWQLLATKSEVFQQGIGALKGFFKESSLIYKALFLAEKAAAIAGIVINAQREISGLAANPFVLAMPPGIKEAYVAKSILTTKLRAGVAIGTIAAQTVSGLAAKAIGGYTDVDTLYGDPAGFVDGPTVFAQGRRSYLAGEAGREFVISNRALQVPAVADFARMLDAVQQSGNYSSLAVSPVSGGSSAGATTTALGNDGVSLAILAELKAIRAASTDVDRGRKPAERPVVMNYRLFQDYENYVDEIKTTTSL